LNSKRTPFQKAKQKIIDNNILPASLIPLLPHRWKRVGTVAILELKPELLQWKHNIGEIYLSSLEEIQTIAHKIGITTTIKRQPNFEVLAGKKETITLHKELGCKFWIDPLKLTFSNGNHAERQRMITISINHEKIIDMFACVGNLSLPIAVHNTTAKIIGIEINSDAYRLLVKNVQENKLMDRYKPILGDNREKTPENWANRVIMGYFAVDHDQIATALASLKQHKGGTIHIHGLSGSQQPSDWQGVVTSLVKNSFSHFRVCTSQKRIVKSVAPGILHFVNDIGIEPVPS
jgi:tRNA wybutosine-synthesizing protein 2